MTQAPKPVPAVIPANCPNTECNGQFYMNEGQTQTRCPYCHRILDYVTCGNKAYGIPFLIEEGAVRFQCTQCGTIMADNLRLAEIQRQQKALAKIEVPPQQDASKANGSRACLSRPVEDDAQVSGKGVKVVE